MAKLSWLIVGMSALALALAGARAETATPAATAAVATAASAGTQAVSPAAQKMVRATIAKLSARAQVDSIELAPMPGFYQVIASGQLLYISSDGRYMLNGDLIDLTAKRNVSDAAWAKFRQRELAQVPASARIVYAPKNPLYTVSVFTDVNCSFCRALHKHIAALNAEGIAVEYLAWPREGVTTTAGRPTPTYTEMVSVWCANDRKAAFVAATEGHVQSATCTNPVKDQFDLGVKLGINGTPGVIGPDGRLLGGYLTPEQLLAALRKGS
ncbi:MAG: DsbC family protein [Rhodanobacter sp.]